MGRVDPEAAVRRYHMLDGAEALSVTVALSGGADSVLLLSLLREWQPKYGYRLSAAHLNHMLRGEESDRDEAFVRAVCEKWSVPLRVERIPVAEAAAPGESVEMAARRIRYAFLDEAAMDFDAGAGTGGFLIAMAHTMSDQAETVLYRLARGSGLKGAGGIPPKRDRVIRPLCELTREDVEALCRERGLDYVTDSSNASDLYARNRIRHQVLPALRRVHPGAVEALARFAGNAREDDALLEGLAAEGLEKSRYTPENGFDPAAFFGLTQWRAGALLKLEPPLRRRALRQICARTDFTPEAQHIASLEELLEQGSGRLELPGGRTADLAGGRLRLLRTKALPAYAMEIGIAGTKSVVFPGGRLHVALLSGAEWDEKRKINNLLFKNLCDYDKIIGKLVLRARKEGDRLCPAGREVTKELRRWYNELAVPLPLRNGVPVLADEQGVLWAGGLGTDRRAAVSGETVRAAELVWEPAGGPFGA